MRNPEPRTKNQERRASLAILRGMRPKWEEHHKVRIADKALEAAVKLSVRFDPDHQLPDKAIDIVDKAGARTRVPVLSMMPGRKDGRRKTGEELQRELRGRAARLQN